MTCCLKKCNKIVHNVVKNRCIEHCLNIVCFDIHCGKRPTYNYEGESKGKYCKEHSKEDMINIKSESKKRVKKICKYTLSIFLSKAKEAHGDKFDYSLIKEEDIKGSKSKLPIKCNKCEYKWKANLGHHVRGIGCPSCSGNAKWTLDRFLLKAKEKHGDKYDYSLIKEESIKNSSSKLEIKCNKCDCIWLCCLNNHVNSANGCPSCSGRLKWTLERFIKRSKEINGTKFDYSLITEEDIKSSRSKVPIICTVCEYKWNPGIDHHINRKGGCPSCSGKLPWTYDRFILKSKEIHGDKYDYSMILRQHIKNSKSYIYIICKTCEYKWETTINSHMGHGHGCPSCSGSLKWTIERFLSKAKELHDDNFDYSLVKETHISNNSNLPITCKTCGYAWNVNLYAHISGKNGCPSCSGKARWTLKRFLEKATKIHGNKYDYSLVEDIMVNSKYSKLPIICRLCQYQWNPTLGDHINGKCGCPSCSGKAKWNYKRFLEKAKEIHGDKFDYSRITYKDIVNSNSRIYTCCKICSYVCYTTVNNHINGGYNCKSCSGLLSWTLETFLEKSLEIHGNKYNYSLISMSDFDYGSKHKIPIICNKCEYIWDVSITSHIYNSYSCPSCVGLAPWTLERFLIRANEVHDQRYDYSLIKEEDIINGDSKIQLTCNKCQYKWVTRISNHVYGHGCPDCVGNAPWTLERFLKRSNKIHDQRYDYSLIKEENIIKGNSKIQLKCNTCEYMWVTKVNNHVNGSGCPKCKFSKGELVCSKHLENLNIEYEPEYRLNSIKSKRYDFYFEYNGKQYLLEYDGIQHFEFISHFHRTLDEFHQRQEVDIMKTKTALKYGYNIIRIDYTNLDKVDEHLDKALQGDNKEYYSDSNMYQWMIR